jgi:uncharacterized protein
MPFNIFRRKKQLESEAPAQSVQETAPEPTPITQEPLTEVSPPPEEEPLPEQQPQESQAPIVAPQDPTLQEQLPTPPVEEALPLQVDASSKIYLKAMPLKELSDIENVKTEVTNGNIIILRITPLAGKSIEDVKIAVNDLFQFAETVGGDIARLGEERVVICPKSVRIWREKTAAPVADRKLLPTTA